MESILVKFICWIVIGKFVNGDVQFQYDSEQCLDQPLEYQCTVTGPSIMRWRILDDEGGDVVSQLYDNGGSGIGIPAIGGGVFTVEKLQGSPSIITNISFTVQSSINGYTIICEDQANTAVSENFTIQIQGIPSSPDNVIIHTDTFTNSSVNISWTESSSPCVTGYRYNISSSTPGWDNISINSTSNSVMVEGLVLSNYEYSVVVTAIDTADRTSNASDSICFLFYFPQEVQNLDAYNETGSDENTVNIIVSWDIPTVNPNDCEFFPMLTYFVVSITTSVSNNLPGPVTLPPSASTFTFDNVPEGRNYTITVIARSGVRNALTDTLIEVPGTFIPTIPSSSSSSRVSSSTSMISTSTAMHDSSSTSSYISTSTFTMSTVSCPTVTGLSSSVSAGISVAITVPVTAVITAIITVIILYLCGYMKVSKESKATHPQDYEIPISTNEVEMKGNTAYGQVKHTTDDPTTATTTSGAYEPMYM